MHALIDVLRDADWPPELLTHELGEPMVMPGGPGGGGGATAFVQPYVASIGSGPTTTAQSEAVFTSQLPPMSPRVISSLSGVVAPEGSCLLFRGLR